MESAGNGTSTAANGTVTEKDLRADSRDIIRPFDDPLFTAGYQSFIIILQIFLYVLVFLRFWVLRKIKYKLLSPRGISDICILLVTLFMTLFFAAYYVGFAHKLETFRLFARVSRFAGMASYPEFDPGS